MSPTINSKPQYLFPICALVIVVVSMLGSRTFSQATDSAHQIGLPNSGTFDGDTLVSVQLNNGNVHIEIPVWSATERGPVLQYLFVYNSKAWLVNHTQNYYYVSNDVGSSLQLVGPADYHIYNATNATKKCPSASGTYTERSGFVLQEPGGTKHMFYGTVGVAPMPQGCGVNTTVTMYAKDGSGWMTALGVSRNTIPPRRQVGLGR